MAFSSINNLSPTLFNMFISDMLMHVNGTPLHMSIILSCNSNIRLKKITQDTCNKLTSWLHYWRHNMYRRPRLVGSLCALLTGHSRLQLHMYRLKLTFSPTCICLAEDETSIHFLSECKLFSHIRNFIKGTGCLP